MSKEAKVKVEKNRILVFKPDEMDSVRWQRIVMRVQREFSKLGIDVRKVSVNDD